MDLALTTLFGGDGVAAAMGVDPDTQRDLHELGRPLPA